MDAHKTAPVARRRFVLGAGLCGLGMVSAPSIAGAAAAKAGAAPADPNASIVPLLRGGGVVLAFRHALAPGTFDPPGFVLEDCSTQRNLDDVGRAQSARIGQWFRSHVLQAAAVRSSPWCRCLDTARIAFGAPAVQTWAALGSPRGTAEQAYPAHQALLRESLARMGPGSGFEVWVTHMFVLQDLVGVGVGSGEALVLRSSAQDPRQGRPQVLGAWRLSV